MVRVTIKRDYIRTEFEFKDFDVASEFTNLALNAATEDIKVEFEKVTEFEEVQPAEPETRFLELGKAQEAPELF